MSKGKQRPPLKRQTAQTPNKPMLVARREATGNQIMKLSNKTATATAYANMTWGYSSTTSKAPVTIGGWTAIAWQEEKKDWNYYSKAWHRSHGPKVTVTGRFVKFISPSGKKTKLVSLEGWRGNWQMKALLEAGLVKPQKGAMDVRLNEACEIKCIGKKLSIKFYSRSLKGELLDYVAVTAMGMTYHAESPAACIKGLKIKQAKIERKKVAVIDWSFLRGIGFCKDGIKEFCSVFGFDLKDSVTPSEVYDRVKSNPSAAVPFLPELRKLAEIVNFSAPELV
jgi:hypothetical protein